MHTSTPTPPSEGIVHLHTVQARPINWLWPGWIPLRKITVVDGDPGLGKSTLLLDLAARVSRMDAMPDGSRGRYGDILLLIAEDSLEDTVKPRLVAAGAELDRVHSFEFVRDDAGVRPPMLPNDMARLEQLIEMHEVGMVIIDPFVAYLADGLDSARDQHMRRALHQLGQLADRRDCAVILLRHLNKGGNSKAIYRGGGSIGIIAAARAGLLVARDPTHARGRILAVSKSNLSRRPPGLKYQLEQRDKTVVVSWKGLSFARPDSLLQGDLREESLSVLEDALHLLTDLLLERDCPYVDILKEAKTAGIGERTLRKAKAQMGVRSYRVMHPKTGARWLWSLKSSSERSGDPAAAKVQQAKAQENPGAWSDLVGEQT